MVSSTIPNTRYRRSGHLPFLYPKMNRSSSSTGSGAVTALAFRSELQCLQPIFCHSGEVWESGELELEAYVTCHSWALEKRSCNHLVDALFFVGVLQQNL